MKIQNSQIRLFSLLLTLFLCANLAKAQARKNDVITKRDSSRLEGTIITVTEDVIQYKKASDPQGPVFYISKSEIAKVQYGNGETETFSVPKYKPQIGRETVIMYPVSPWLQRDFTNDLSPWRSDDLRKAYQFYNAKAKSSKRIGLIFGVLGVAATVTGIIFVSNSRNTDSFGYYYNSENRQIGTGLIVAGVATGISVGIASGIGVGKYRRKANIVMEELVERKEPLVHLSIKPGVNLATRSAGLTFSLTF
jgi:hypothetical protein